MDILSSQEPLRSTRVVVALIKTIIYMSRIITLALLLPTRFPIIN